LDLRSRRVAGPLVAGLPLLLLLLLLLVALLAIVVVRVGLIVASSPIPYGGGL
jgi:hypothetical protein